VNILAIGVGISLAVGIGVGLYSYFVVLALSPASPLRWRQRRFGGNSNAYRLESEGF
jgi:hypothetical protein